MTARAAQGLGGAFPVPGDAVGGLGLAVLVAIANSGTGGLSGEALRVATADGLRSALLAGAVGAGLMVVVALNLRRPSPDPRMSRAAQRLSSPPSG